MKRIYIIEIELENQRFQGVQEAADEVAGILDDLNARIRDDCVLTDRVLVDSEGSKCGRARIAKRNK